MNDITTRQLICIVDDERTNAELVRMMLEDDYDICVAHTGEEALSLISNKLPDLVLLDIMLPDISGYEVCERLQETEHTAGIPVVFVTGLEDKYSEETGLELGAVDFVVKPVVGSIVKARIKRVLETDLYIEYLEKTLQQKKAAAVV